MNEMLEDRLSEVEVKLTFIDDTVHALASADASLSQRVAAIEHALRELRGELSAMRTAQSDNPHDEPPPPHY